MRLKSKKGAGRRLLPCAAMLAIAVFVAVQTLHAESEGVSLDKNNKGSLLSFRYNSDPVGLQGKICSAQYQYEGDVMTVEFFYWGYDQNRVNIKRVIKTPDKKGNMQRREEFLMQDPNAEHVCSLEPVPGRRLMLELDNFNQILVSEVPSTPIEGLEGY